VINTEESSKQDTLYQEAAHDFGSALDRLTRAYEANPERRRDLLQEIHIALWRSMASFNSRCSLRTWVYRVAHNVATSHVIKDRRINSKTLVSLDVLDTMADESDVEQITDQNRALERLMKLIQQLNPLDRQVILLYLEGMDTSTIGEVTGISPANVSTKIHRIKEILAHRFHEGRKYD
jgi:RNA polymerase sigma-70 factor (ECF subfamily)